MTDPSTGPDRVDQLDDRVLLAAYERTSGEAGSRRADELLAEIQRRGLDV